MSRHRSVWCRTVIGVVLAVYASAALAVGPADYDNLYRSLSGVTAQEDVRLMQTGDGHARFVGAPPGAAFQPSAPQQKALRPAENARVFVQTHAEVFGVADSRLDTRTKWVKEDVGRSYVRLQQTYAGLPVFAAEMAVQMNGAGGVESVLSDVMRTGATGLTAINTQPGLTGAQAVEVAKAYISVQRRQDLRGAKLGASTPELMVLDPAVVGGPGQPALVWRVTVKAEGASIVHEVVFVNAHTGAVPFGYPLAHPALNRTIRDANYTYNENLIEIAPGEQAWWIAGQVVRTEGQAPSGLPDADLAYDYLGDTYRFYFEQHGRDSLNGLGLPLDAVVRIGYGPGIGEQNAYWTGWQMAFGPGFVVDDVVGHELTHGVTQYTSNLVYAFQSGAINESFSDIWGEFVDLTNGRGNDSDAVRWLMGEDLPIGAIRDMKNPPAFGDPDRMSRYLDLPWYHDNGGVHFNSGIGNKLAYLLTDGDYFNGYTVRGMGIPDVAKLFYELQTKLLTAGSDYFDLYAQLYQASVNLGWSYSDRMNLQMASQAVEIVPYSSSSQIGAFQAVPTVSTQGKPVVAVTWRNPTGGGLRNNILVRKEGSFPTSVTDGTEIYRGIGTSFVDGINRPLSTGRNYFYAMFSDVSGALPQFAFARAKTPGPERRLTEAFSAQTNPIDLAYTQLLFSPVGSSVDAFASGQRSQYYNYSNYDLTVTRGVYDLPVARDKEWRLHMTDDGYIALNSGTETGFPFFGERYSSLLLASNGYIVPAASGSGGNFPSLAAHYAVPRLSFLFADLAPNIGGNIWARSLDDRFVLTYDHVPEFTYFGAPRGTNTFQVELFDSGHIRITYLGLSVSEAIVGLSNGRGVPTDPAELRSDLVSVPATSDLSAMVGDPTQIRFWPPVPEQVAEVGEWVTFTVTTTNFDTPPRLLAQWERSAPVPFTDNGDGTGTFRWRPAYADAGIHRLTVSAQGASTSASLDVGLFVYRPDIAPTAQNVALHTDDLNENPRVSREVPDTALLRASYDYYHPQAGLSGRLYGEGFSTITWYRNGAAVPAFLNADTIPASYTTPGDTWMFQVTPKTALGLSGEPVSSPRVTIVARPQVAAVTPAYGPTTGGTEVVIQGTRLSYPLNVYFGGVRALTFRALSDTEILATTPVHLPGDVDVKVVTVRGEVVAPGAFRYENDPKLTERADLNGDGRVDAVDVQIVVNSVLGTRMHVGADVNQDGSVNVADIQAVVFMSLRL